MKRWKLGALMVLPMLLIGCQLPGGHRPPAIQAPLELQGIEGVQHVGDRLTFAVADPGAIREVEVTTTNGKTGESKNWRLAPGDLATRPVVVDAEHFPGLATDVVIQYFAIQIRVSRAEGFETSGMSIIVSQDRDALPPAQVPLGRAPLLVSDAPPPDLEGEVRALAAAIVGAWGGQDTCMTSSLVAVEALSLPRLGIRDLPASTKVHEYEVHGRFPTRVIGRPWLPSDQEVAVVKPRGLRFAITEQEPVSLLGLKVLEEDGHGECALGPAQ